MVLLTNPENPRRLGDFEILRELGRGGMGVVYEARQVSLNRKVALKVLRGGLGLSPKAVDRFLREAEAAARLHHTNIVPVYATGEQDGIHYFTMELIDGPSLEHTIQRIRESRSGTTAGKSATPGDISTDSENGTAPGPDLPPDLAMTCAYAGEPKGEQVTGTTSISQGNQYFDDAARMLAEVADALEHAHQSGVIHRDIKPSNLLQSTNGRLSISDFGLARMLEQPGMTVSGEFVGTPAYMSPEQITAGRTQLDHRTDIYSLGATLYELLTLQPPFTGQQRDQVLSRILHKEPVAPRKINPRVPVDLETICLKALEKDPDRRYQTAGAMGEDLTRYVRRFAITARRAGPLTRLGKWVKRHPGVAASLGVGLLAICVALGFGYQAHRTEQQRIREQQAADERLREEQDRALQQLLDEKIRNAYLVATSGDLTATDAAIKEIEKLGASTGQVRLLRGVVAYFRQDTVTAIGELEQAVELLPESVTARALLAISYCDNIQWERYEKTMVEMIRLKPVTPEDFLFKGYARDACEPGQGWVDVNEGIARRDSPLGRALRTVALTNRAIDTDKVEDVEAALADADVARGMRPNNPMVLYSGLYARMVAADFFQEQKNNRKREELLAKVGQDIQAIGPYMELANPGYILWHYHESNGQPAKALELARRSFDKTGNSTAAVNCSFSLYKQGRMAEALQILEKRQQTELIGDITRAFMLVEVPDGPGRAVEELGRLERRYPQEIWELRYRSYLLLLLGRKEQAVALLRKFHPPFAASGVWKDFNEAMRQFGCGEITAEQYLARAGDSHWRRCQAHFEIGLFRLAEGDRAGAREHFAQAVKTRANWFIQWPWSLMFLSRLQQDPEWPKWVKARGK